MCRVCNSRPVVIQPAMDCGVVCLVVRRTVWRRGCVTATSDVPFDSVTAVRDLLRHWIEGSRCESTPYRENLTPANEPAADYEIVYEAVFEPEALDQVRAEFWVTREGRVSVGLERWSRVAQRVGARYSARRFVAGHEPATMTPAELQTVLSLAANGDVVVGARVFPLLGLTSVDMVGLAEDKSSAQQLRHLLPWLRTAPRSKYNGNDSVLRYSPWPARNPAM